MASFTFLLNGFDSTPMILTFLFVKDGQRGRGGKKFATKKSEFATWPFATRISWWQMMVWFATGWQKNCHQWQINCFLLICVHKNRPLFCVINVPGEAWNSHQNAPFKVKSNYFFWGRPPDPPSLGDTPPPGPTVNQLNFADIKFRVLAIFWW